MSGGSNGQHPNWPPSEMPEDLVNELTALHAQRVPLTLLVSPWQAWCLMQATQLAWRHPAARQTSVLRESAQIARRIQALVATTPALWRVAEEGWHAPGDPPASAPS